VGIFKSLCKHPAPTHLGPELDGIADGLHGVGVAADEESAKQDAVDTCMPERASTRALVHAGCPSAGLRPDPP
jgi:hypothetical protein